MDRPGCSIALPDQMEVLADAAEEVAEVDAAAGATSPATATPFVLDSLWYVNYPKMFLHCIVSSLGLISLVATLWFSVTNPIFFLTILTPLVIVLAIGLSQKLEFSADHIPLALGGFIPWGAALAAIMRLDLFLFSYRSTILAPTWPWVWYTAGFAAVGAFCWYGFAVTRQPRFTMITLVLTQFCIFVALSAGAAFMLFAISL